MLEKFRFVLARIIKICDRLSYFISDLTEKFKRVCTYYNIEYRINLSYLSDSPPFAKEGFPVRRKLITDLIKHARRTSVQDLRQIRLYLN